MNFHPNVEDELKGISLGDRRLDRRAILIAQRAGKAPGRSFPQMVRDSSELEAFYRFFQNDDVDSQLILKPHQRATIERCNQQSVVRVIHDTSTLTFNGEREGLRPIVKTSTFCVHPSIAVSGDELRMPLGVLALTTFVQKNQPRWPEKLPPKLSRDKRNSAKWINAVREVQAFNLKTPVVHIMDREADNFCLMADMLQLGTHFVIRAKSRRRLGEDLSYTIQDRLQCARTSLFRTVPLSRRKLQAVQPRMEKFRTYHSRDERDATLHVRATRIIMPRATYAETDVASIKVSVVQVFEPHPPSGEEPVEWTLLTDLPIDRPEQIADVVDHYRARWRVEEFFRVLKSGCSIERRQLTDLGALVRALSFFSIIAWRLLAMKVLASSGISISADILFDSKDIAVLRFLAERRKHPFPDTPTIQDVLLTLAAIGGHLKRNGSPGWMTIGRGYDDFHLLRGTWGAQ